MAIEHAPQLTFDVGGELPEVGLVRFSGSVFVDRDLPKGEEVHLQVVGRDGEILANGYGKVVAVSFKDTVDKYENTHTERIHSVQVS